MNIGVAATQTGLPAKTLRYYEDIGLISPSRDSNGYRDYSDADIHKLVFLGRARALGFTIEHCRTLLGLWENPSRSSADVKQLAGEHLDIIESKIADLCQMRDTLLHLMTSCKGDERADCPIINELASRNSAPR